MGAPGPGPPRTGLRSWGGDPDFGTWESMNSKQEITRSETYDANPGATATGRSGPSESSATLLQR